MFTMLSAVSFLVETLFISTSHSFFFGDNDCYTQPELNLGCFRSEGAFQAFPEPNSPSQIDVKFRIYSNGNEFPQTVGATSELIPGTTRLNVQKHGEVVFLVHGYHNSENNAMMRQLKQDFLELNQRNLTVVLVDWSEGATQSIFDKIYEKVSFDRRQRLQKREVIDYRPLPYGKSSSNTRVVGALIARLARFMKHDRDHQTRHIHCIGFSLGAQTCGFAGKRYLQLSAGTEKLDRITGLDPAGPMFDGKDPAAHLWHTDADFVDVIHTNSFAFGFKEPMGHVDFYAGKSGSYGVWQPSCAGSQFSEFLGPARDLLRRESAIISIGGGGNDGELSGFSQSLSKILDIGDTEIPNSNENLGLDYEIPASISLQDLKIFEKILTNGDNVFSSLAQQEKAKFSLHLQKLEGAFGIEPLRRHRHRRNVLSSVRSRSKRMINQLRQRFEIACSHNRSWEYFSKSVRGVCQYRQRLPVTGGEGAYEGRMISMGYRASAGFRQRGQERKVVNVDISNSSPFCGENEE